MRRALAVLAAGVSLFALAACDRPVPDVSLQTRGTYVSEPAARYCFTLDKGPAGCRIGNTEPREITVRDGASVGIDVPRDVGSLWDVEVSIPGNPAARQAVGIQRDKTHLSVTPRFDQSPRLLVEVISGRYSSGSLLESGRWRFLLVRQPKPSSQPSSSR
ncbi:MAG: hypothetical protein JWN54_3751 [Mycobacterium sp.]|nr:hypothetical protein [Mycobacterium sp.]